MAVIHDGQVVVTLTAKVSWWVQPYLWTASMLARSIAPFVPDIDDERIEAFSQKQAAFIASRGVKFYAGKRRI
ncbi:hypothetical protein [Mesorhizobium sp.]|uniref:hypothetical protein n=1 Tax=Mesorhizobium sp. TaxID=1871066 RepID=UPI000FE69303|nr:hypothetical protein [Mesorhizobium sp.]RWN58754.1 MAG: hypothetical protein EOS00_20415 [Mesorhizobium sp.]